MTKEELLENPYFKAMPKDTEIVFLTDARGENCRPLREKDMSFRSEIVGLAKKEINPETGEKDGGDYGADPIYRNFLVINTNPY